MMISLHLQTINLSMRTLKMYHDVKGGYAKWDWLLQQSNTSHLTCNNHLSLYGIELLQIELLHLTNSGNEIIIF